MEICYFWLRCFPCTKCGSHEIEVSPCVHDSDRHCQECNPDEFVNGYECKTCTEKCDPGFEMMFPCSDKADMVCRPCIIGKK